MMTVDLARAVEAARHRRNDALTRVTTTGYPAAWRAADETDADFRRASHALDRYLAGGAHHDMSEATLIEVFDRVGAKG